jgi:hypothetical protein
VTSEQHKGTTALLTKLFFFFGYNPKPRYISRNLSKPMFQTTILNPIVQPPEVTGIA